MTASAILFDLDGTLLDTLEDIALAANEVLDREGHATHPIDAYRRFVGEGVRVLFERALPGDARTDEQLDRCAAGFRETYGRLWNVHSRPYDGIVELLVGLTDRGLPLAVLSNKPDAFTRQCVDGYFPDVPFAAVLGQREGIPRKPDPAGATEIAGRLDVPAAQFMFVGDTPIDMGTARAAGMVAVGVTWGFRPAEELRASGAAALIERPAGLLGILGP